MRCAAFLAVALLGLAACGASASRVTGPDGSFNWYAITCRRNKMNCVEKAGEVCPNGYRSAEENDRDGAYAVVDRSGGFATTTYHGEMLIKCKGSPAE